jgi:glutathione S-transferase
MVSLAVVRLQPRAWTCWKRKDPQLSALEDLVLVGSGTSPFVRKCRVAAHELGIDLKFVREQQWAPDTSVPSLNPLGKVPVLKTPDLGMLYDSRVILADLERRAGRELRPADPLRRIRDMRLEALGDGIGEAVALNVQETWRPEDRRSAVWSDRQKGKVERGVKTIEACHRNGEIDQGALTPGLIASLCALEVAAFWLPDMQWRTSMPALAEAFGPLLERPSFTTTQPFLPPGAAKPSL